MTEDISKYIKKNLKSNRWVICLPYTRPVPCFVGVRHICSDFHAIILVQRSSRGRRNLHLNTYFSVMKIDPKYTFFLNFQPSFLQNLWPSSKPFFFFKFRTFCIPKQCTHIYCLVLKNKPNYVSHFTRMISNLKCKHPLPPPWGGGI